MKNISKVFLFFLAATVFVACGDDDKDKDGPSPTPSATMSTTYHDSMGVAHNWKATTVSAREELDAFIIEGSSSNPNETFVLWVNTMDIGVWDYYTEADIFFSRVQGADTVIYTSFTSENDYALISVTALDTANHTVSGTFQYVLTNTMSSTDMIYSENNDPGVFENIPYTPLDDGMSVGSGSISVTVDGTPKSDNNAISTSTPGGLMLTGTFGSGGMTISIPNDAQTGASYALDGSAAGVMITYMEGTQFFSNTSGSINITSHNTASRIVSGTFNGTLSMGAETLQLTNGSFNFNY